MHSDPANNEKWTFNDRFTGCMIRAGNLYIFSLCTGALVGEVKYYTHEQAEPQAGTTSWDHEAYFRIVDVWGVARTTTLDASLTCNSTCNATPGSPAVPQPLSPGLLLAGTWRIDQPTAWRQFATSHRTLSWTFTTPHPDVVPPQVTVDDTKAGNPAVRCDRGHPQFNRETACVYPAHQRSTRCGPATRPWETQQHIREAMATLPGSPGSVGNPLHYLADNDAARANRRRVCAGFPTRPFPLGSCDEYLMASTKEGGNPQAVSLKDVPGLDNSLAGSEFSRTIQRGHVLDGEPIVVNILD